MTQNIKQKVALLPLLPGVYQFLNKEGEVIYVGKAKSLKKRVSSYFMEGKDQSPKVKIMVRHITNINHIVTTTEADALLLENNIIKNLQPRYNVMLKDDKTYPWIVIRKESFPRIESTRRVIKDGSRYFGPYSSVMVQKNVLELIRGVYQLRTCSLNLSKQAIEKGKYGVCLEYHIGNCKGPCVGEQTEEDYNRNIEMIIQTLSGDMKSARKYLQERMEQEAAEMRFEQAQIYKKKMELLDGYISKSIIVSNSIEDIDVFSMIKDVDAAYCNFVRIVGGAVVNSFTAQFTLGIEEHDKTILTRAIKEISDKISGPLAREVIVPFFPEESLFTEIKFIVPKRGDKVKLLEFSQRNARMYRAERLKNIEIKDPARHTERILEAMRRELRLEKPPKHIECFDNSNLQGTNPVAACVVFRDAKPAKKEYRHFNIKTVIGPNDFASMREIIYRRYKRLLDEGGELPDLIVVDGGKGQLSSAYAVLEQLGLEKTIPIIGLAERIDEVFYPKDPMPYYLERTGEPLRVIRHLRDEAHRFGITFHRKKRSQDFIKSELEEIVGLGEISRVKLLKKFKTVSAIKKASTEQLKEVVGQTKAEIIKNYFEKED